MPPADPTPQHPIGVVTTRTGLSTDLLRAWERRYRVVVPARSPGGHRLYSDADVDRLRLLHKAVQAGRSIGGASKLTDQALAALIAEDDAAAEAQSPAPPSSASAAIALFQRQSLDAVASFDPLGLERILRRAASQLSVAALLDDFLAPLLWEIGARWERGDLSPAHEHLASAEIRRHLGGVVERASIEPAAPVLVVATPAGQLIELGAMMVAASAATEGWRVVYLGTDLPASEIAAAAIGTGARAVAISLCHEAKDPKLTRELERLVKALPAGVTLLVGGRAASSRALLFDRLRAESFRNLEALRRWLRTRGATRPRSAR